MTSRACTSSFVCDRQIAQSRVPSGTPGTRTVSRPYHGASRPAFGTLGGRVSLPKPLKRPTQDRAKFTVQALYDGFVRICVRDGWDSVSMRALAEETGYAVGTLYEYFPNRDALLSGYVRHAIEARLELAREQACIPDLVAGGAGRTPRTRHARHRPSRTAAAPAGAGTA